MKKLTLITLLFIVFKLNGQTKDSLGLPMLDKMVGIQEIIPLDSSSSKDLYSKSKSLFVVLFKSAKDVIQLDDPDNFTLIGKGISTFSFKSFMATASLKYRFTLKIESKENRYRYTIDNILILLDNNIEAPAENYLKYPNMNKNLRVALGEDLKDIKKSIIKYMSQKEQKDKW